jgi:hypothetical protein
MPSLLIHRGKPKIVTKCLHTFGGEFRKGAVLNFLRGVHPSKGNQPPLGAAMVTDDLLHFATFAVNTLGVRIAATLNTNDETFRHYN